jgi:hypothetical protein
VVSRSLAESFAKVSDTAAQGTGQLWQTSRPEHEQGDGRHEEDMDWVLDAHTNEIDIRSFCRRAWT